MKCLIASVENTGTHYLAETVGRTFDENVSWVITSKAKTMTKPVCCLVTHLYPLDFYHHNEAVLHLFRFARVPILSPMRHPVSALISNVERGTEELPLFDHILAFARLSMMPFKLVRLDLGSKLAERDFQLAVGADPVWPDEHLNRTDPTKHTELRTLWAERDWSRLDDALDGALRPLRQLNKWLLELGYEPIP